MLRRFYFLFILFLLVSCVSNATGTNIYRVAEYLQGSRLSAVDKYRILYSLHVKALSENATISYDGLEEIRLEIPQGALPIPLGKESDFANVTFNILNNYKRVFLFELAGITFDIDVKKADIDKGSFFKYSALNKGKRLLVIVDKNPWVRKRRGHDYGATRKDILYIENGVAKNKVISPYNNKYSNPICAYSVVEDGVVIRNVTFERNANSRFVTNCIKITNINDVRIDNVKVTTLGNPNKLYADWAISINGCTNVSMHDVTINGTYSLSNKSGYGICMDNVWNSKFVRLYGHADWGVFGNNNLSNTILEDCDINRFDIHCYGKDVSFFNCKFSRLYNQFGGVYGTILYDSCSFVNFTPYLMGGGYNAHVPVTIVLQDCYWELTKNKTFIAQLPKVRKEKDQRPELVKKYKPEIVVNNLTTYSKHLQNLVYSKFKKL